jgi:hypothetical protein
MAVVGMVTAGHGAMEAMDGAILLTSISAQAKSNAIQNLNVLGNVLAMAPLMSLFQLIVIIKQESYQIMITIADRKDNVGHGATMDMGGAIILAQVGAKMLANAILVIPVRLEHAQIIEKREIMATFYWCF